MPAPMPRKATAAPRFLTDEERWAAVRTRDVRADGAFCFGVLSTGIYCRPGCAARTPRRENVRFFADRAAAEAAGLRACKRCRPDADSLDERHAELVARACRSIETAERAPSLRTLAQAAGFSPFHFQRVFKARTGLTPKAYAQAHRNRRLRDALHAGSSVTASTFDAGFNASTSFYRAAKDVLGMPPTRYRRGGDGMAIRFALAACSLGMLLVAATDNGLCAIHLGDDADALERELRERFPRAQLLAPNKGFARLVARVVRFIEAPRIGLDLPLDIRGTAFQQRVWQALRDIPAGATASYSDVATGLGLPSRSVRAVASAIAANPLAVAIPCHRVVRANGEMAGYRWGVDRKRALIALEADAKKR